MADGTRAAIRGVLLEGLNFAGKTTTARLVAAALRARGVSADARGSYICETPVTAALQGMAHAAVGASSGRPFPDPDLVRPFNVAKSALLIVDSALAVQAPYTRHHGVALVQDRHWFTQYCNNEYFNPGECYLGDQWRVACAPRFTVQAYLTCSSQVRVRRCADRPDDRHGLNKYFRSHIDRLNDFDEFCIEKLDDQSWIVVNTDKKSSGDVAEILTGEFLRRSAISMSVTH